MWYKRSQKHNDITIVSNQKNGDESKMSPNPKSEEEKGDKVHANKKAKRIGIKPTKCF